MNRWSLSGLLALALLAAPARAEEVPGSPADTQKRLEQLEKEMALTRKIESALQELRDINRRLADLERKVDEMQKPQERTSRFPPNTGMIRLQNRLSVPATIIVGGIPHRLQPGEQRDLQPQPAGTFEFEALVDGFGSLQPRATRTLQAGQIYTIFTYLP
ncbi:MAG: hypothetical protein HYS12_12840 [Planctomycetes bacterium]|nr:hypothetical protein [Planctomycetota bacterium]